MLREANVQTLTWADKTMSVLKAQELEACEKRLAGLPDFGLFGECDDARAETLWACSYDAQEHPHAVTLHTARGLQAQVLTVLPAEAALLSPMEHSLLERLLILEGEAELMDLGEMSAAESLVRRLWCTVRLLDDNRVLVRLPDALRTPLQLVLDAKAHGALRDRLMMYSLSIEAALYTVGMLPYPEPLAVLREQVLKGTYADDPGLALRFLRVSYDYMYDAEGQMLLLHPGLTDPARLMDRCAHVTEAPISLEGGLKPDPLGRLPLEQKLLEKMTLLLLGAVRPELTEIIAAQDLLMLAKQGVSLAEMTEVLSSLLTIRPTGAMLACLRQLHDFTPRWGSMRTALVQ